MNDEQIIDVTFKVHTKIMDFWPNDLCTRYSSSQSFLPPSTWAANIMTFAPTWLKNKPKMPKNRPKGKASHSEKGAKRSQAKKWSQSGHRETEVATGVR